MLHFREFLCREGLMGAVEPLIGEGGKKKKKKKKETESGPDTPIQLNKGVPNRYGSGRDTGQII